MIKTSPAPFAEYAAELRPLIDAALSARSEPAEGCPDGLREAIRYSLLGPGKRLRPMLVLLSARACGGSVAPAMPAACAVEMVHAYSLVHDDLPAMDDDDLRRGRPTCHKKFGEPTAILAGDALLTMAFEVLAKEIEPPQIAAECCAALARTAGPCGMVGGQADDVGGTDTKADIEMLESIHRRKTGAMIGVSLRLGALIAGADGEQLEALGCYGRNIGLAFQITDDLLDVRGNEQAAGKRLGKDAQCGRLTFPGLLGIEPSTERAERLIHQACDVLAPLGTEADGLESLAMYVLERDR